MDALWGFGRTPAASKKDGTNGTEEDADLGQPNNGQVAQLIKRLRDAKVSENAILWIELNPEFAVKYLLLRGEDAFARLLNVLSAGFTINLNDGVWGKQWTKDTDKFIDWLQFQLLVDVDFDDVDKARVLEELVDEVWNTTLDNSQDDPNSIGVLHTYFAWEFESGKNAYQRIRTGKQQIAQFMRNVRDESTKELVLEFSGGKVAQIVSSLGFGALALAKKSYSKFWRLAQTSRPMTEKSIEAMLANAQRITPGLLARPHGHHIVMKGDWLDYVYHGVVYTRKGMRQVLKDSKEILKRAGIEDINDTANMCVAVNQDHTLEYAQAVLKRLQAAEREAGGSVTALKQQVKIALDEIAKVLGEGKKYRYK